jgi:hypothetical protein
VAGDFNIGIIFSLIISGESPFQIFILGLSLNYTDAALFGGYISAQEELFNAPHSIA